MSRASSEAIAALVRRFGEALSTSQGIRQHHASGVTFHATKPPDAVLFATSTEEVSEALRICHAHHCPVIPFGTGTSTEGQISAEHGGLTIDLSRMNEILRISAADMDCTVQAGVTRKALNLGLRDTGLFFPVDPGADASIGGMASTRASGTNAVRYGTMREAVMSLRVVLANGDVIETGTRARKSSAGYDLTRLFVGSEGTLGVITEVTFAPRAIPEHIGAAVASFATVEDAVLTVVGAIQSAVPIARAELLDALQVKACNRYSKLDLAGAADALSGISRDQGRRRRAGRAVCRYRRRLRRDRFSMGKQRRGKVRALAGASRCLVGSAGAASGFAGRPDRHLRPDIDAPRGHLANAAGCGRVVADCTALRPRRRRQLSSLRARRPLGRRRKGPHRRIEPAYDHACSRRREEPARASTESEPEKSAISKVSAAAAWPRSRL